MLQKQFARLIVAIIVLVMVDHSLAQQWNEFRGPDGSGLSTASDLPIEWSESNYKWKTGIEGRGWSSPVMVDDQIWMTTAIEIAAKSKSKNVEDGSPRSTGTAPVEKVILKAVCVEKNTGQVIHSVELFTVDDPPHLNALNSYASPTPVIDGSDVFCTFGTMGTACVNRDSGKVTWRNEEIKIDHQMGPGSSPVVVDEQLVINCDGMDKQFVVALDKKTGRILWKSNRTGKLDPRGDYKKAYSTPTLVNTDQGRQIVSPGASWIYAYSADDGKELWKLPFGRLGFSNSVRPIFADNKVLFTTGFMKASLMAIDLTNAEAPKIAWQFDTQVPTMSNPIVANQLVFMVSDRGIATCVDLKTGEKQWQQRLDGEFCSSPIFADGRLYVGNRDGAVYVLAAEKEFKLLATNELDSDVMATPAAVDNCLIVRTRNSLYRIEK